MGDKVNRRELILDAAAKLFVEHGYSATSVRQIAEAVGCTDAALYYHFKEGKRELFSAVIESNVPNLMQVVDKCQTATTFAEFVHHFGTEMSKLMPLRSDRFRWMIAEFPRLDAEERAHIHHKYLGFVERLKELVTRFVGEEQAESVAWLVACSHFGYAQIFINLEMNTVSSFSVATLDDMLGKLVDG